MYSLPQPRKGQSTFRGGPNDSIGSNKNNWRGDNNWAFPKLLATCAKEVATIGKTRNASVRKRTAAVIVKPNRQGVQDFRRILRGVQLPPQVCHPFAGYINPGVP